VVAAVRREKPEEGKKGEDAHAKKSRTNDPDPTSQYRSGAQMPRESSWRCVETGEKRGGTGAGGERWGEDSQDIN